ncbi:hypothetical protein THAOC_27450, partial [Thalassiosira oceanica]
PRPPARGTWTWGERPEDRRVSLEHGRGRRAPGDHHRARLVGGRGHGARESRAVRPEPVARRDVLGPPAGRARAESDPVPVPPVGGQGHHAVPDDGAHLGLARVVPERRQRQPVPPPVDAHPAPVGVDLVDHHLDGALLELSRGEELVPALEGHGVGQRDVPVERAPLVDLLDLTVRADGDGGEDGRVECRRELAGVGPPSEDEGVPRHARRGGEGQRQRDEERRAGRRGPRRGSDNQIRKVCVRNRMPTANNGGDGDEATRPEEVLVERVEMADQQYDDLREISLSSASSNESSADPAMRPDESGKPEQREAVAVSAAKRAKLEVPPTKPPTPTSDGASTQAAVVDYLSAKRAGNLVCRLRARLSLWRWQWQWQ